MNGSQINLQNKSHLRQGGLEMDITMISNNQYAQEFARNIPWQDILEPFGFGMHKETLNSGETGITWTYNDGEVSLSLFTCGEIDDAVIFDWDHVGKQTLSKFDAIRRFRCNGNWSWAKAMLLEGIDIGGNAIDKIGRKTWAKFQQSSNEMSAEVRYVTDALYQARVDDEFFSLAARDLAKVKFEELKFAQDGTPVEPISLEEFLSSEMSSNAFVIEDLLVSQGKVFLAAKAKAGKTTLCLALLKSFVTGHDFLGRFKVTKPEGAIGYINMELTDAQMQRWTKRLGIAKESGIHFWNLRGKPNPLRSEASRRLLIDQIRSRGVKTLFIDTFAKVFSGNANDNSEVNRFLVMLDGVLESAGVEQLVMLVHAGHEGKRIRGATALNDHPDSIWYLTTDEAGNRYFSAIGRDVDVPEGHLSLDMGTYDITYTGEGRSLRKVSSQKELLISFVESHPGCKAKDIDEVLTGTKESKIRLRSELVKEGLLVTEKGFRNAVNYFLRPSIG